MRNVQRATVDDTRPIAGRWMQIRMTDLRLWTFADYMIRDIIDVDLVSTTYRTTTVDDRPRRLRVFAGATTGGAEDGHTWAIAQARAVAELRHPNVLTVHAAGHHDDRLYVASDDVRGHVLREYVTRHHPLRPPIVAALGQQLAEALDAIHAAGLVHGSINPHTIWIGEGIGSDAPIAYLTGFGAARLLAREVHDQRNAPASDDLVYIAPEQIRDDRATPEADRYALACALYHLLTGMPPFRRGSVEALLRAHLSDTVDSPAAVRDDTSHALDSVFDCALAKQSSQRYPSAHALVVDFQRALRAESVARSVDTAVDSAVAARRVREHGGAHDNGSALAAAPRSTAQPAPDGAASADVTGAPPPQAADEPSADVGDPPSSDAETQPSTQSTRQRDAASSDSTGTAASAAHDEELTATGTDDIAPTGSATRRGLRTRTATLLSMTIVLIVIVIAAVVVTTRDAGDGTSDADVAIADEPVADDAAADDSAADDLAARPPRQQSQDADVAELQPLWSTSLAGTTVRTLMRSDDVLFVNAGRTIGALDPSSGEVLWIRRTTERVRQTAVVDGVAVAITSQDMIGYDVGTGAVRWRSDAFAVTPEALAAGADEVFAARRYDWGISLSAIAPGDGAPRLLGGIAAPGDPDKGPLELAFDRGAGATGRRMLYALTFGALHAFDPDAGVERWRAPVDPDGVTTPPRLAAQPWVRSLNASGGAVFLVGRDGRLCRYDGDTGVAAWTSCRWVPGPPQRSPTLDLRAGRVVVAGSDAVAAYDFTSGSPLWSRSYANDVELTVAGSADATVVADDHGMLRALDHTSGQQRWRSRELGAVTALLADDDGVYVGDAEGGVTRVAQRALGGSDDR